MSTQQPTPDIKTREARNDIPTSELVNLGIALVETKGKRKAAAFLHKNGVSFPVIVRVLNDKDIALDALQQKKLNSGRQLLSRR